MCIVFRSGARIFSVVTRNMCVCVCVCVCVCMYVCLCVCVYIYIHIYGAWGGVVVKALRY
jgi:hypothetical protein